ncbi:MAG: hypothetical protein JSV98_04570 [candidate division WOR-3 bacterium]|nr:MAG: hypothetical protein JSV98_04570 [candidate division WOR-3 bacterium]
MAITLVIVLSTITVQYTNLSILQKNPAQQCFDVSYQQVSDSMLMDLETKAGGVVTRQDPFVLVVQLIEYFSGFDDVGGDEYFQFLDMMASRRGNVQSYIVAICVVMQKWGWDVQYLHNGIERYIGLNFNEKWAIRQGHWVEIGGRKYYLKVFDDKTPVGELLLRDPVSRYECLEVSRDPLKPLPLITRLPQFVGAAYDMQLNWSYGSSRFGVAFSISEEQVAWTRNLPASLHGMVASGVAELTGLDLVSRLRSLMDYYDEYDQVNILLKFCQSEDIFIYDSTLPIISVSRQLVDARNDCDGRSVLLHSLLTAVLDYPDTNIVFVEWPYHVALALKPMTLEAEEVLRQKGTLVGGGYYILDPSYIGDTVWGSAVEFLDVEYELIFP